MKSRAIVSYVSTLKSVGPFKTQKRVERVVDLKDIYIWADGSISLTHCVDETGKLFVASAKIFPTDQLDIALIR